MQPTSLNIPNPSTSGVDSNPSGAQGERSVGQVLSVGAISPRAAGHSAEFTTMKNCWACYKQPPRALQHQIRSPEANLRESARLGHVDANMELSRAMFTKIHSNPQASADSIAHAKRALQGVAALAATARIAHSIGEEQTELLRSHYCKLMNSPDLQPVEPSQGRVPVWVPNDAQAASLMKKIQNGLQAIQEGRQLWGPLIARDVDTLANGLLALNRGPEAAALYQQVLDALPTSRPAWY